MGAKIKTSSLNQLMRFLGAVSTDPRIGASHVSVYMSLFQFWLSNGCQDPIQVNRRGIMANAKISGVATYHKCIKDLHAYGHIRYLPSYHPLCHSQVFLKLESF
jgi:hypothetical protein